MQIPTPTKQNPFPLGALTTKYKKEDTEIWYNTDDPELTPIKIDLPKAPKASKIDGYGLEPKDQKFKAVQIPQSLQRVERKIRDDISKAHLVS